MKKRNLLVVLSLILTLTLAISYQAKTLHAKVGGGDITYTDTKNLAPVIFSHESHQKNKLQCTDCHVKIFQMKKGVAKTADKNAFSMKNLESGKYCGACHNGKKAFTVKGNCTKCHKSK